MERFNGIINRTAADPQVSEAYLPVRGRDNHAANLLELDNGDLLCVWFSGSGEGNPDTTVVLSRLASGSHQWTAPEELSMDPDRSEQNPVLFQAPDGKVWLLHTSNEPHNQKTSRVVCRLSEDQGHTWGPPNVIFDGPGIFLKHPPVVLMNGDWLLPVYYCTKDGHYSAVQISRDRGATWKEYEVPGSLHRVQMSVVERGDGSLYAMYRSRQAERIYSSVSHDLGRTWTVPEKTSMPNNNSSIQLARLNNNDLALVYNDATLERDQFRWVQRNGEFRKKTLRTPLTLALSENGGKSWPYVRNIQMADLEYKDSEIGYSYPTVIAGRDRTLHIAFSYLRKGIKYVRLEPDWVKSV